MNDLSFSLGSVKSCSVAAKTLANQVMNRLAIAAKLDSTCRASLRSIVGTANKKQLFDLLARWA
jgi:hypothetical protein